MIYITVYYDLLLTPAHVPTKVRRITLAVSSYGGCPSTATERETSRSHTSPIPPYRISVLTPCPHCQVLGLPCSRVCKLLQQHRRHQDKTGRHNEAKPVRLLAPSPGCFHIRIITHTRLLLQIRMGGQQPRPGTCPLIIQPQSRSLKIQSQVGWLLDNDGISRNPITDPAWKTSNSPYVYP
jgi:hypothetical protein